MTLDDMADFICGKVNQREAEDVAAAKGFLTRRHEMIWQHELWKDSLVEYRQTLDPDVADYTVSSNYLPSKGVLLLPPIFQRIYAARTAGRKLNVQRPEYFYRTDFDAFSQSGDPAEYILLPPCVWEWNTSQAVLAKRDAQDATSVIVADLLDSDGAGVTRVTKTLDEDYKLLGTSERIDAINSVGPNADVNIGAPGATTITNASLANTVLYYFSTVAITNVTGMTPAATVAPLATSGAVTPGAFMATSIAGSGAPIAASAVPGGTMFGGNIVDVGLLGFTFTRATPSGVTLLAGATNVKKRQRLRLVEIPSAEVVIRVLGKRVVPSFTSDQDEPGISGMENCLIAFGLADMLQRDESYAEADAVVKEAVELLAELKRLEVVQQAHHSRIIPEVGYGDDYFETPRGFQF